jgi:hypothetical protein
MLLPFPQNLTARVVSGTEIELSWQAAGEGLFGTKVVAWQAMSIDGYRIERSTTDSDADFRSIAQVTTTNYQDTTVQPGTTYHYQVSAIIGNYYSWKIGASAKTSPDPPPFPTHLTQEQAIQTAAAFCKSIGNLVTATACATATAEYRVVDNDTGPPIRFWLPRWKVIFEYQAEVDVVDATSTISLYRNDVPKKDGEDYLLAGDAIPQHVAIQYAEIALRATGHKEEQAAFPTAKEWQLHSRPPLYRSHYWLVEWQRQLEGIPYRDQAAVVSLQAETGHLESISFVFPTPPVTNASIILPQQQAYEIAQSILAKENITYIEMYRAETEIVQPNSFWQNRSEEPLNTPVKAAWTFRFSGRDSDLYYVYEVWVDAQTADVIGGHVSFMRKSKKVDHDTEHL